MSSVIKQWGHYYADQGLIVVPVKQRSKKPAMGNGWQYQNDNTKNISFLHPDSNVGVLNGDAGKINLVDIDLDCPEALVTAPFFLPLTVTFGRINAPSSHWEYIVNTSEMRRFDTLSKYYKKWGYGNIGTIAEFRCNSGNQTVFPPSTHECRDDIQWDMEPDENGIMDPVGEMTRIGVDELFQCYCDLIIMIILQQHIVPGVFHNATVGVVGWCWHMGWPVERTERLVTAMVMLLGMEDEGDRLKVIRDTYTKGDNGHNISAYSKLESALNENLQSDSATCITALKTIFGFTRMGAPAQLTAEEVFSACSIKMQAAMEQMEQSSGLTQQVVSGAVIQPTPIEPQSTPVNSPVINAPANDAIQNSAVEVLGEDAPFIPENMEVDLEQELLDTHNKPFSYIIEGLLPENEVGFVFGASGSYKSFLMLDMVMSIAYKDKWCGMRISQDAGDVLWCAGEGRTNIADRTRAWKQENGIIDQQERKNKIFLYNDSLDLFDDPRAPMDGPLPSWLLFSKYLEARPNIKLAVLDTWSSLFSGDENASRDVAPTLKRLLRVAQEHKVTPLIVHHKGKDEFNSNYRGSGAMTANSDFHFDISRELKLAKDEKASKESERTGRIIFEDKQQRSSASTVKLFFKPRVINVHNRFTNFSEQLRNVVMDWEEHGKAVPLSLSIARSTVGFGAIYSNHRESTVQIIKDMVDMFQQEKSGDIRYKTNGFTLEELFQGIRSRFMQRGSDKIKNKYNLARTLERLRDVGLIGFKQEGTHEAILYYYLNALAHTELRELALLESIRSFESDDVFQ